MIRHSGLSQTCFDIMLLLQIMDFTFLTGMREAKLVLPPWLAHMASDAQVEANCLRVFQAFVDPQDGTTDLRSLIKQTIGQPFHTLLADMPLCQVYMQCTHHLCRCKQSTVTA